MVFIPTVSHLRAYLAAFSGMENEGGQKEVLLDKPGKEVPLLVVYGIVDLHRDSSEWSAQGLGNSMSSLVEAGWRTRRKIVALEDKGLDGQHGEVGVDEEDDEAVSRRWKQSCKVWEQKLPMLNGSVRRAGMDSEDGAWSGRTIEVGRIFARWFVFVRENWK